MNKPINIAIIGCGFVADYYMANRSAYPHLNFYGVYDKDSKRLKTFCDHYELTPLNSVESILSKKAINLVLNLTDPRSHYAITKQCLEGGKHVYSEKPLAMSYPEAKELTDLAKANNLRLVSAPCSVLSKAAQTLSYAVNQGLCGTPKLVYAELDDGMVHKMVYKKWLSVTGAPWPYRDEFEVGCTLEHAGYYLAWLIEIFGAVKTVTAFSDCLVPRKILTESTLSPPNTADASFGILKFESGVVVRLSTTIVAPHDHSIRVIGDNGVISLKECWDNDAKVYFRRLMKIRRKTFLTPFKTRVKLPYKVAVNKRNHGNTKMDFLLGVDAIANHIESGEEGLLSTNFCLHVNEVALALQYAGTNSETYIVESRPT